MESKSVELRQLNVCGSVKILEFDVAHSNEKSTVDQKLTVEKLNGKWVAKIEMDKFPSQDTAKEAAHKLGDWMVRLGQAIIEENNEFETISLK